jgi:hypothetical protein
MTDVLIVQQFEILIINIFGMHIGFIILQVSTIMEVLGHKLDPVSSERPICACKGASSKLLGTMKREHPRRLDFPCREIRTTGTSLGRYEC